jgi:hypothetical protein
MPPLGRAGTAPRCRWAASPGLLRRTAGTAGGGSPTPPNRASTPPAKYAPWIESVVHISDAACPSCRGREPR